VNSKKTRGNLVKGNLVKGNLVKGNLVKGNLVKGNSKLLTPVSPGTPPPPEPHLPRNPTSPPPPEPHLPIGISDFFCERGCTKT